MPCYFRKWTGRLLLNSRGLRDGLLGKIFPPFRSTTRQRSEDNTATMRRDIGAGDEIFLSILTSARFFRFPQRNWPIPDSPAVNCPNFAATSQPSFVLLPVQDKTEEEFFLQHLRTSSAGSSSHLLLDCPAPSLPGVLSLAPLLPFLSFGPDLGAWPDCWVSA